MIKAICFDTERKDMHDRGILRTEVQRGKPVLFSRLRKKRIEEALSWSMGGREHPHRHIVTRLPDGLDVYFLKPGKEVFNERRPNPHDMTPLVGSGDERLRFDQIWSCLSKVSVIDFDAFKQVLTLIYRNAYLLDHVEVERGKLRYLPNEGVQGLIDEIQAKAGHVLPYGVLGFLHFLDLLGWNEDVKYHVENGRPTFEGHYGYKVGRPNTFLTCIRVPYQTSDFIKNVLINSDDPENIDFQWGYDIMQQFAKSRGTCTPTLTKLKEWLDPYIV